MVGTRRRVGHWSIAFGVALALAACGDKGLADGEPCDAASDCKSGMCSTPSCFGGVCYSPTQNGEADDQQAEDLEVRCVVTDTGYETSDASTGEATTGPSLDLPAETSTTGTAETGMNSGCEKIDFLFVIDNSGSMSDEQDRLVAAFPGFLDAIRDNVQGQDHHIMVVDSDESAAWVCEEFQDGGHCGDGLMQPNCEGYVCGTAATLPACARELGAGVRYAFGGRTANMDCGFPAVRNYLASTDPNLDAAFACAAKVGTSGNSTERPFSAMTAALTVPNTNPGDCNDGFLRDDAILVVTIVTDDPPSGSGLDDSIQPDATPWYEALVDAKSGNAEAAVVIGFLPTLDTSCVSGNSNTPVFEQFMTLVGNQGVTASVCDTDYASVFANAISTIDTTCETFNPPG